MKISQKDAILIKNLYLSKQYGARKLLSELPHKDWKLGSIDSLLKRIHKTGTLSGKQAAVDRVRRIAVEDLVLSQVDKPKSTDQFVRFRIKLSFSIQVCTNNSP